MAGFASEAPESRERGDPACIQSCQTQLCPTHSRAKPNPPRHPHLHLIRLAQHRRHPSYPPRCPRHRRRQSHIHIPHHHHHHHHALLLLHHHQRQSSNHEKDPALRRRRRLQARFRTPQHEPKCLLPRIGLNSQRFFLRPCIALTKPPLAAHHPVRKRRAPTAPVRIQAGLSAVLALYAPLARRTRIASAAQSKRSPAVL